MLHPLTTLLTALLFAIWISPSTSLPNPSAHVDNPKGALQQPLRDITLTLTYTTTVHTTSTLWATSTITATRYDTTAVPEAVQTWYAGQHTQGCDRTACASCRVWYACGKADGVW